MLVTGLTNRSKILRFSSAAVSPLPVRRTPADLIFDIRKFTVLWQLGQIVLPPPELTKLGLKKLVVGARIPSSAIKLVEDGNPPRFPEAVRRLWDNPDTFTQLCFRYLEPKRATALSTYFYKLSDPGQSANIETLPGNYYKLMAELRAAVDKKGDSAEPVSTIQQLRRLRPALLAADHTDWNSYVASVLAKIGLNPREIALATRSLKDPARGAKKNKTLAWAEQHKGDWLDAVTLEGKTKSSFNADEQQDRYRTLTPTLRAVWTAYCQMHNRDKKPPSMAALVTCLKQDFGLEQNVATVSRSLSQARKTLGISVVAAKGQATIAELNKSLRTALIVIPNIPSMRTETAQNAWTLKLSPFQRALLVTFYKWLPLHKGGAVPHKTIVASMRKEYGVDVPLDSITINLPIAHEKLGIKYTSAKVAVRKEKQVVNAERKDEKFELPANWVRLANAAQKKKLPGVARVRKAHEKLSWTQKAVFKTWAEVAAITPDGEEVSNAVVAEKLKAAYPGLTFKKANVQTVITRVRSSFGITGIKIHANQANVDFDEKHRQKFTELPDTWTRLVAASAQAPRAGDVERRFKRMRPFNRAIVLQMVAHAPANGVKVGLPAKQTAVLSGLRKLDPEVTINRTDLTTTLKQLGIPIVLDPDDPRRLAESHPDACNKLPEGWQRLFRGVNYKPLSETEAENVFTKLGPATRIQVAAWCASAKNVRNDSKGRPMVIVNDVSAWIQDQAYPLKMTTQGMRIAIMTARKRLSRQSSKK